MTFYPRRKTILHHLHRSWSPADSTTYYFGGEFGVSQVEGRNIFIAPMNLRITDVYMSHITTGTAGSNEVFTTYIRENATTDTQLYTTQLDASKSTTSSANNLNIALTKGTSYEIKVVTPAWATNPTNLIGNMYLACNIEG